MRGLLSLRMAWEHLRAGFGRMALSVVAIALGVALVVAIRLMNGSVLESFLETVDGVAGRAALTVSAGEGLTFPEAVVESVAAVPGVTLAVPLVRGVAFPDDASGELLTVHGVDLGQDAHVRVYGDAGDPTDVIDDLLVFLAQPDSVVLGREFAARRGLAIGSPLPLVTPAGIKTFTVRGLLDPQGLTKTLGGRLLVMDLYAAELAFTAPGQINQIDVLIAAGVSPERVKGQIAAALPPGLKVEEPAVRKEILRRTVGGFQAMLTAFSLLAVVAGFIICYSRLGAIFEARTWEVGVLRAVGLRRAIVFGELLKESLLLGAVGTALGIPLGILVGRYALPIAATATAINFRLPIVATTPSIEPAALVLGGLVGLVAAILAATVPALRVARKEPVAALTMRGREMPSRVVPIFRRLPGGRAAGGTAGEETPARDPASGWLTGPVLLGSALALTAWQLLTRATVLGNVTTALIALAACAFSGLLVQRGSRWLGRVWEPLFGPAGELAADHVSQHGRRAALTVATLGLALGAILMFSILGWSFERTLVAKLGARFRSALVVSSAFFSGGYRTAPVTEAVLAPLRQVPGVALAVGNQSKDVPYRGATIVLDAYDPPGMTDPRVSLWPLDSGAAANALARVAAGEGAIVSSGFARQYATRPGDVVHLDSPNGDVALTVLGVTGGQAENAVIMSRDLYRRTWNDGALYLILVATADGADPATVEAAIRSRLGREHRLRVISSSQLVAFFAQQVRQAFGVVYLLALVTLLLVLVAIGDTLATGVLERTRDFGVMRAIGLDRKRLFRMVVLEGVTVGVLGLALALGTGLLLGAFWVRVQFPDILGWELAFHLPWIFVLATAAVTLVLCFAGSLLPAVHAARLAVPQAIRNE
jgi:putative ABC transport system permease protein